MALQGFQPFDTEPLKHARYTAFLQAQAAGSDALPFARLPAQNEDEFAKELHDYAKSALIFKPMSASMAGRFTSASVVVETGPRPVEGLHVPTPGSTLSNKPEDGEGGKVEVEKELSAKENAAKVGMYGPLTREVKPWMPSKLLCKRFGVKEPVIETKEDPRNAAPSASSTTTKELLAITDGDSGVGGDARTEIGLEDKLAQKKPGRRDIANIGMGEDETQGTDILTYERPAMDIFKAIFASDDENSDSEDEGKVTEKGAAAPEVATSMPGPSGPSRPTEAAAQAQPKNSTKSALNPTDVDLAVFRPTFVSRSDRSKGKEKEKNDSSNSSDKAKKKDRKSKNKGKSMLMSFDVDMDGGNDHHRRGTDGKQEDVEKKRKKKRREEKKTLDGDADDDESMWVEKPPPESVQTFESMSMEESRAEPTDASIHSAGPTRGRKRAIDFM